MARQIRPGQLQENVLYNISASFAVSASHEIIQEISSSYAQTASIAENLFGNPSITVTNITASGNISASSFIEGLSFDIAGRNLADLISTDKLRLGYDSNLDFIEYGKDTNTSHFFYGQAITASGNISASGTTQTSQVIIPSTLNAVKISNITALGNSEEQLNIGKDANWSSIEYGRGATSLHNFLGRIVVPNITASANISASGTIIGSNLSGTNTGDITLTGTPDYITISNQVITRNQIDLANDVTGVLPSANLDADTAHLTTDQTFSGKKTFSASITASANISASGDLIINNITASGDIVLDEDQRIFFEADKNTYIESHASDTFRAVVNARQMFLLDEDTGNRAVFGNGTKVYIGNNNNHQPTNQLEVSGSISVFGGGTPVGGHITASGNISSSGTITGNSIVGTIGTATQGTIDHDSLANFVANEHIDHTSVTLTAGNGLSGGGDISTNRSFAVDAAQTTITSVTNTGLKVGRGTTDTYIDFGTDDKIQ